MKILGIILLIIAGLAAVGIFFFHQREDDDLAKLCIWVFAIAALLGFLIIYLPEIFTRS